MKERTVIATNRFGLGARPGDFDSVDRDPQAWLLDQLQGPSRTPADQHDRANCNRKTTGPD